MDFILDGVKLLSLDSMVSHAFTHKNKSALRPGAKNQIEAQLVTDHFAIADKANMPFIINALEVNECLTVSQKKPITPHFLLAFKGHLNLDNPLHATLWEVCLVTFFGLLRKANLQCKGRIHTVWPVQTPTPGRHTLLYWLGQHLQSMVKDHPI